MTMNEMFDKIDAWEWDEIKAASAKSAADAASVNRVHAIRRKFADMRRDAMKVAFNAEQFNRRADWVRKGHDDADAMFPASH